MGHFAIQRVQSRDPSKRTPNHLPTPARILRDEPRAHEHLELESWPELFSGPLIQPTPGRWQLRACRGRRPRPPEAPGQPPAGRGARVARSALARPDPETRAASRARAPARVLNLSSRTCLPGLWSSSDSKGVKLNKGAPQKLSPWKMSVGKVLAEKSAEGRASSAADALYVLGSSPSFRRGSLFLLVGVPVLQVTRSCESQEPLPFRTQRARA